MHSSEQWGDRASADPANVDYAGPQNVRHNKIGYWLMRSRSNVAVLTKDKPPIIEYPDRLSTPLAPGDR
jgi:hypothetical protein